MIILITIIIIEMLKLVLEPGRDNSYLSRFCQYYKAIEGLFPYLFFFLGTYICDHIYIATLKGWDEIGGRTVSVYHFCST